MSALQAPATKLRFVGRVPEPGPFLDRFAIRPKRLAVIVQRPAKTCGTRAGGRRQPVVGHRFNFRADWGAVDCQVLAVEPNKTLSHTWAAYGLESVVTWTLTPTNTGTQLRMEQSGFRPEQQQAYQGAKGGWQQFFAKLEQVVAKLV